MNRSNARRRLSYERKITWLALGAVAPALLVALALLWFGGHSSKVQWTLTMLILGCVLVFISSAREHIVRPLQTLSNLLAALREGDYSIRARGAGEGSAMSEVLLEVNSLGETLRQQRLGAFEATALLRTIMSEIDVAIFTFDPERRLRLVNRAGETLLGRTIDKLLGKSAKELGLGRCFDADEDEPLALNFPGWSGRWGIRRSTFRERGLPHELLVLTDLSRTLREEERRAWQRLVRVLGHEMNNSLAPIKSLAASLESRENVALGGGEKGNCFEVLVEDDGPGIMNPANLFVPFFTTKPDGSGIGLPLSRQIAEAHDGTLLLTNRQNATGAQAVLRLPL